MIDSTNPRQMADNIKELEKSLNALSTSVTALAASITPVVANPEGDATVQLTKVQIGEVIYGFEAITPPEETTPTETKSTRSKK